MQQFIVNIQSYHTQITVSLLFLNFPVFRQEYESTYYQSVFKVMIV